jgi:hypothetical protein
MKKFLVFLSLLASLNVLALNCTTEDDKGCENVSSTREYTECMYKKIGSLTPACKKVVSIYKTCINDIESLCPGVDSEHTTFACLIDNKDKLSPMCQAVTN